MSRPLPDADRLAACERHAAIAQGFETVLSLRERDHAGVVEQLGRNCHMPNAALTPLHAALHHEWRLEERQRQRQRQEGGGGSGLQLDGGGSGSGAVSGEGGAGSSAAAAGDQGGPTEEEAAYTAAIRDALAAGGCCASRAGFAGALLGARLGPGAVPAGWLARMEAGQEVARLFDQLHAARGA